MESSLLAIIEKHSLDERWALPCCLWFADSGKRSRKTFEETSFTLTFIPFAILAFAVFPFAIVRATSRPCSTTIFRMMGRLSSTTRGALHGCTKEGAILSNGGNWWLQAQVQGIKDSRF